MNNKRQSRLLLSLSIIAAIVFMIAAIGGIYLFIHQNNSHAAQVPTSSGGVSSGCKTVRMIETVNTIEVADLVPSERAPLVDPTADPTLQMTVTVPFCFTAQQPPKVDLNAITVNGTINPHPTANSNNFEFFQTSSLRKSVGAPTCTAQITSTFCLTQQVTVTINESVIAQNISPDGPIVRPMPTATIILNSDGSWSVNQNPKYVTTPYDNGGFNNQGFVNDPNHSGTERGNFHLERQVNVTAQEG